MANEHEIKSEIILVKEIFSTMWFRIPEYQRPYIWSKDEVSELLDDLTFAQMEKPNQEYFLGSFVYQSKKADPDRNQEYDENDLLDGQQRMTTLLLLMACIRDLTKDVAAKEDCQNSIFQKGSVYKNVPERNRIVFAIRKEVQDFVDDYVNIAGGTDRNEELAALALKSNDKSIQNMAQAIGVIRDYFQDSETKITPEQLLKFLMNQVLLIYIATQDLDDAFRLFTILNDRGVPLRNSDILKSLNLGKLEKDNDKIKYATLWEEAESSLGDDFDRFLNHIRTLLVKEKARLSVLQEFEDRIYNPKEKDKATGKKKPALLKMGKDTFQLIERYLAHYNILLGGNNYDETGGNFRYDNLIRVMSTGLPSTDWIPPLMRYFDRFKHIQLLDFLVLLDNKFSADWIGQYTPTDRIEYMNEIIKAVEQADKPATVLANPCFKFDQDSFVRSLEAAVYGRKYTRYILLKLDYYYQNHSARMTFESLSVEHILPQNPADDSAWKKNFSDEYRETWTNRLGNLVLISTKKNTSQGRLDYAEKKAKYFKKNIDTCPNSLRVLQNAKWTPEELESNQAEVMAKIQENYGIQTAGASLNSRELSPIARQLRLDERNHVEKPLLDQLAGMNWEIIDLTKDQLNRDQRPGDSHRENFTEVVMLPVMRERLKIINPWLEDDQVDEVVKQLTASFPSTSLLENNKYLFQLLLENTSVSDNRQTGEKSPTVHFVDFPQRDNNRFIAVCQFKIRILGTEHHMVPDIVLFLNGLPVVVIECKSPKVKDAIPEAIDQLMRYSEQRGAKGEGSAPLFYYNQILIATCRQEAKFGTITTQTEKYFYRWADPYPKTVNDLDHGSGSPNDQQRLVAGILDHNNLLDLIRTFTLFSTNEKGQTIKIVGRYQQFRAVKLAVKRLLEGKTPRERSGIIWHTQGSGKSLTMMFMVREMYRHPKLASWKIIFITDRTQLEQQLSETSQSIGFTVKIADSINRLKELLRADTSDLVMAMIHKFRETDLTEVFPELNASPNILQMTDEAHRSVYKLLGANLDKGLPNASKIGYTGTPIDKTERVFGDYIDKYTMRQAIDDGVTLEIVYEGRTHNAEVTDQAAMDAAFADVFSDYNLQERLAILGYGTRDAYLEAVPTIKAKAKDMVEHYLTHVYPNGYKAQVVATSREAAVRYKTHIDNALKAAVEELEKNNPCNLNLTQLKAMQTDVIISGRNNDLPPLKLFSDNARHDASIKSFKMAFGSQEEGVNGDMGFLIVNNMLITGFDAPVEQVMYLDKVVVAHNLLQAIARVNRVGGESKDKGFVVDYVGIGHHLKKAIDVYDEREQKEVIDALSFPEEELRELRNSYTAIMDLLKKHGLTDLTDHDAFFDVFYDEDIRFDFMLAHKKLTQSLNVVFPARQALDYMADYEVLTEIYALAGKHFRDERLSMKGIPPKLRAITDEHLVSRGIKVKVSPISILDEDFQKSVGMHSRTKTKAAEVEHAIRHHLDVELDDDPELQASFAQALADIFVAFRDNWNKIFEELEKLRARILNSNKEPTYGLHRKKQMPFFRSFKRKAFGDAELDDNAIGLLVALTQHVYGIVERELRLTGFWESIPARNKLKAEIQKTLLATEFSNLPGIVQNRAHIISRVMEIAETKNDIILYAA